MAVNKKREFRGDDLKLSVLGKALAHPARITILKLLAEKGPSTCGQIVERLPLSQSTVSQHLKELREAGLITGTIDGPRVMYEVNAEQLLLSKIFVDRFFSQVNKTVVKVG